MYSECAIPSPDLLFVPQVDLISTGGPALRFRFQPVCLLIALTLMTVAPLARAQETRTPPPQQPTTDQPKENPAPKENAKDALPIPPEHPVATQHELTLDGKSLKYTATAGNLLIRDEDDKPYGSIFYVAYTLDGADPNSRPVSFLYNGGPGSATLWLHMGSFSPVRIETDSPNATGGTAVQAGAEPVFAARQNGPGLHRCAAHGLFARCGQGDSRRTSRVSTRICRRSTASSRAISPSISAGIRRSF